MKNEMKEEDIRQSLKSAFDKAGSGEAPAFDRVWASAEAAHGRSQGRIRTMVSAAAAIALIAVTTGLWSLQQAEPGDDYLIAEALMNSTLWAAPSDSLMPEHQFDIYQEIPFLIESTRSQEGTLL